MEYSDLHQLASQLRLETLEFIHATQTGHTGDALSVIEILTALYFGSVDGHPLFRIDPEKPLWDGQDYIVLSHHTAAAALYAVLAERGFLPKTDLSQCPSFPFRKIPGISITAAAPGHGFAAATGLSIALQADRAMNRVCAVLSDREVECGIVAEAAMVASARKLDHLCVVVNHSSVEHDSAFYAHFFEGLGWRTLRVADGHNIGELIYALMHARRNQRVPTAIIASTVLGKGVPFAEGKSSYAHVPLSSQEMVIARTGFSHNQTFSL